jgi:hypothetical protein
MADTANQNRILGSENKRMGQIALTVIIVVVAVIVFLLYSKAADAKRRLQAYNNLKPVLLQQRDACLAKTKEPAFVSLLQEVTDLSSGLAQTEKEYIEAKAQGAAPEALQDIASKYAQSNALIMEKIVFIAMQLNPVSDPMQNTADTMQQLNPVLYEAELPELKKLWDPVQVALAPINKALEATSLFMSAFLTVQVAQGNGTQKTDEELNLEAAKLALDSLADSIPKTE